MGLFNGDCLMVIGRERERRGHFMVVVAREVESHVEL